MTATFPAGMTKRARFIEAAVGFRINAIRRNKWILSLGDEQLIAEMTGRGIPLAMSLESERFYAEQTVAKGFRMEDVRDYAMELMTEH